MVCKEMKVSPEYRYTGTKRGWVGDVRLMLLDTGKLERLGWKESVTFAKGVRGYVSWLKKTDSA